MQLLILATHYLPARGGRKTGLEITPEQRYTAQLAAGQRPSVAAAISVGLVYVRKEQMQ